jgi:hypothetical protein
MNTIIRTYNLLILIIAVSAFGMSGCAMAAPNSLTIAAQGKSTFSIVIPQNAPPSVQAAAQELQKDIEIATKARLPILLDNVTVAGNFISLGATVQAAKAQISAEKIADEGFCIVTKNKNIYIIGPDTKSGEYTKDGGTSNGTANGVYTFLEDYLDVRWLMPGDLGRDVPAKSTFNVLEINRTETPRFVNRREPYIQNGKTVVRQWEARQKLGFSFNIVHWHNWTQVVKPEYYAEHPDWFAMINGKRQKPNPRADYKIESTNPEVVRLFADTAIAALKKNPEINTYSISPSDGGGWSESPESKALYDQTPSGKLSVTPLVLKFYNDVAKIVGQEYPQGKLAGYIYAAYLYPPSKGDVTLPDNFYPVIAPSINYGFKLYHDDVQKDFAQLMSGWSKVTPHLLYYDLPNWITPSSGILTSAAPDLLNIIFKSLIRNNVKGVYIYGLDAWSNAAMPNYVMAKMMWNPELDAHQLQREWLLRAYGSQAGMAMGDLYNNLDNWYRDYFRNFTETKSASYKLTDETLKNLYTPHYVELEQLFLKAQNQPMTKVQQKRLQLIADNLSLLQWTLRSKKMLPADYQSPLTKSNAEIVKILQQPDPGYQLFPGINIKEITP